MQKLELCLDSVKYCRHIFTWNGLEKDLDRAKAISEKQEPTSVAEVRTFLGMVTYAGKAVENLSTLTEPLHELIKESNKEGRNWKFHFEGSSPKCSDEKQECCSEGEDAAL